MLIAAGGATSIAVDNTGLHLAVGTSDGCVVLWADRYGLPIHTVRFHSGSGCGAILEVSSGK